jgi:hypothetical protein
MFYSLLCRGTFTADGDSGPLRTTPTDAVGEIHRSYVIKYGYGAALIAPPVVQWFEAVCGSTDYGI